MRHSYYNKIKLACMQLHKIVTLVITLIILTACATKPPMPAEQRWQQYQSKASKVNNWQLLARISIKTPDESLIGNFSWTKQGKSQTLNIYNSLGNSYLKIESTAKQATLITRDGQVVKGKTVDQVLQQVIDWPLSISDLQVWIKGLVKNGRTTNYVFNQDGLLQSQAVGDWQIDYSRYQSNYHTSLQTVELPKSIKVSHPDFSMKLSIRQWFKD